MSRLPKWVQAWLREWGKETWILSWLGCAAWMKFPPIVGQRFYLKLLPVPKKGAHGLSDQFTQM